MLTIIYLFSPFFGITRLTQRLDVFEKIRPTFTQGLNMVSRKRFFLSASETPIIIFLAKCFPFILCVATFGCVFSGAAYGGSLSDRPFSAFGLVIIFEIFFSLSPVFWGIFYDLVASSLLVFDMWEFSACCVKFLNIWTPIIFMAACFCYQFLVFGMFMFFHTAFALSHNTIKCTCTFSEFVYRLRIILFAIRITTRFRLGLTAVLTEVIAFFYFGFWSISSCSNTLSTFSPKPVSGYFAFLEFAYRLRVFLFTIRVATKFKTLFYRWAILACFASRYSATVSRFNLVFGRAFVLLQATYTSWHKPIMGHFTLPEFTHRLRVFLATLRVTTSFGFHLASFKQYKSPYLSFLQDAKSQQVTL